MDIDWTPWIEHTGGHCPSTVCEITCSIKLDDGMVLGDSGHSVGKDWGWGAVIAYRIPLANHAQAHHGLMGPHSETEPANLKPRDLACFQQVADVIGEDNAAAELGRVIDANAAHPMSSGLGIRSDQVANAFVWDETPQGHDFWHRIGMGVSVDGSEYTGGSVSYYTVRVLNPTNPTADQYDAECNDIIEALQMNYAEGNAFKALWRRAAARMGKHKRGYDGGLYDAEKVQFFGGRLVEQSKQESGHD